MSFPIIPFDEGEKLLDWIGLTQALAAGHKLPKAEIADSFLYRGKDTLLNRAAWIDGMGLAVKSATVFPGNPAAGKGMVNGGVNLYADSDGMLEALRNAKGEKPRLVHRIDRDTSGILVVARTRGAAQKLTGSFRTRDTQKTYWALVKGVPKKREGRISTWLLKETTPDGDRMRVAKHGEPDADHAVSHYRVIEQAGQNLSWLEMQPYTGRTHQLRVHAAHLDCPIIGDPKYFEADQNWDFPGGIQNKLHLHARRIVIPHPDGKGTVDVTAPLPPHMVQSWNLLGFDKDYAE